MTWFDIALALLFPLLSFAPSMPTADPTRSPSDNNPAISLADLSRNASAISTDSSDSSPSVPYLTPRPRPIRNFSAPRSLSPHSASPRTQRIPAYLSADPPSNGENKRIHDVQAQAQIRSRSKSRGRPTMNSTDDFKFGAILGEGSYSTASPYHIRCAK